MVFFRCNVRSHDIYLYLSDGVSRSLFTNLSSFYIENQTRNHSWHAIIVSTVLNDNWKLFQTHYSNVKKTFRRLPLRKTSNLQTSNSLYLIIQIYINHSFLHPWLASFYNYSKALTRQAKNALRNVRPNLNIRSADQCSYRVIPFKIPSFISPFLIINI